MKGIAPVTVTTVPEYRGLNGDAADNFYRAGQRAAFLKSEVITPFTDSLKAYTDFDDDNIPDEDTQIECHIGKGVFVLRATPTTKRPGYKDVFETVDGYLHNRMDEYKAAERPVGILTIDGEAYVSAEEILKMIGKEKRRATSKGVRIGIEEGPEAEYVDSLVVPLGLDMGELNEGNLGRYVQALGLLERYAKFISGFEEDLLGQTGFNDSHMPVETEHSYQQLGLHIFHVKTVPYQSTSFGKVVGGLDKNPPKKNVENGGDLSLVTHEIEIPRLGMLDPRIRDGEHMVKMRGLMKRMDNLVKEHTQTKIRQPIGHYPVV